MDDSNEDEFSGISLVYGWVIGHFIQVDKITNMVFCQYTRELLPPECGWVHVGRTIAQDESTGPLPTLQAPELLANDTITVTKVVNNFDSPNPYAALRVFIVSGCSFSELNGRYLEDGVSVNVPNYINVRGWRLFRVALHEIAELGIFASGCYEALKGLSVGALLEKRAAIANIDIVNRQASVVVDGTVHFKRRFAELSRAGTRVVNEDQTCQLFRNDQLRANIRNGDNEAMLSILRTLKHTSPIEDTGEFNTNFLGLETQPVMAMATGEAHKANTSQIDLEIEVTLSRQIEYQIGSQAYPVSKFDKKFLSVESELTNECIRRIEERELQLENLKFAAQVASQQYLQANSHMDIDVMDAMDNVIDHITKLREATIHATDAIGNWARICLERKKKMLPNQYRQPDLRENREYCVIVAVKGPMLYPQSLPMVSQSRRFKRGLETSRNAVDMKLIGVYKTREEAVDAFSRAMVSIPSEQLLAETCDKKMFIGLRACHKHYLVRSNAVSPYLPCEHCTSLAYTDLSATVVTSHSNMFPQFIWKGQRYLEKMWQDCSFLAENVVINKLMPDLLVNGNPLLLPTESFKLTLDSLATVGSNELLDSFKSRREEICAAIAAGTVKQAVVSKYAHMGKALSDSIMDSKFQERKFLTQKLQPKSVSTNRSYDNDTSWTTQLLSTTGLFGSSTIDSSFVTNLTNNDLARSVFMLCQSSMLTRSKLPAVALPQALDQSTLQRLPITSAPSSQLGNKIVIRSSSATLNKPIGSGKATTTLSGKKHVKQAGIVYDFRGAKLTLVSSTQPLSHRVDDVWCRSDVGEWHGLTKGRAMRSYEFQENLVKQGKAKEAERKRIQDEIRFELTKDIVVCDVVQIKILIQEGKIIKGSVLQLDITAAENFLTFRKLCIKSIRIVQRVFRGHVSRVRVNAIRAQIRLNKKRQLLTEEYSAKLAKPFVAALLTQCVQAQHAKAIKPVMHACVNVSGVLAIASIYLLSKKTQCHEPVQLCSSCATTSTVNIYDPLAHKYRSARPPCTCSVVQKHEEWLLKIFDPLTRQYYLKDVLFSDVRDCVLTIPPALAMMHSAVSEPMASFGDLNPAFLPDPVAFDGRLDRSFTQALIRAAAESSVLPRLPKLLDNNMMSVLTSLHGRIIPSSMKCSHGASLVDNIEELSLAQRMNWVWEPFTNIETLSRYRDYVKHHISVLEHRVRVAMTELSVSIGEYEGFQQDSLETEAMGCEDLLAIACRTSDALTTAINRVSAVMSFNKASFEAFQAVERNETEDWQQAWDDFENGTGWRGLSMKRQLLKVLTSQIEEFNSRKSEVYPLLVECQRLRGVVAERKANVHRLQHDLELFSPNLEVTERMCIEADKLAMCTVKSYLSTISLPRKARRPKNRRFQRVDYHLVFTRDPLKRSARTHRGAWTFLDRKIICLRPMIDKILVTASRNYIRCIVEVFVDPVTGYYIINVGQDERPMEEEVQHLDFALNKEDFSDMTSHALPNEIVLRPADVKFLLKRSCSWPKNLQNEANWVRVNKSSALSTFVVPSLRPRSLTCLQWRRVEDKFVGLAHNYSSRRQNMIDLEHDTAQSLITYLRLQPHTGRPCLGLLHFMRRIEFSKRVLEKSQWLRDVSNGNPIVWCNDIDQFLFMMRKMASHISLRSTLDWIEVRIKNYFSDYEIGLMIPFQDILTTLQRKPILLASFLFETVLNKFSVDSVLMILESVDVNLPGEELRCWRNTIWGEHHMARYNHNHLHNYRGPVYRTHCFLVGTYFHVEFRLSASLDFAIELSTPIDGNFSLHQFFLSPITIDLAFHEVLAFVIKKINLKSVGIDSLNILHSNFREQLFTILLDHLCVNLEVLENEQANNQVENVSPEVLLMSDDTITGRVFNAVKKFNCWASSHARNESIIITQSAITDMVSSLNMSLDNATWTLQLSNDSQSHALVQVYTAVWSCEDLDRYYGCKSQQDFRGASPVWLQSYMGAPASCLHRSESQSFGTKGKLITCGLGLKSYWVVSVYTDKSRAKYVIECRPSNEDNQTVQRFLSEKETEDMSGEDALAADVKRHLQQQQFSLIIRSNISTLKLITIDLMKRRAVITHKIQDNLRSIARLTRMFMNKTIQSESVGKYYEEIASNLHLQFDSNNKIIGAKLSHHSSHAPPSATTNNFAVQLSKSAPLQLFHFAAWLDAMLKSFESKLRHSQYIVLANSRFAKSFTRSQFDHLITSEVPVTTANINRHSPLDYAAVAQSYRSKRHWTRKVHSTIEFQADIKNSCGCERKCSQVLRSHGQLISVSRPILGPCTSTYFDLYNSFNNDNWSIIIAAPMAFDVVFNPRPKAEKLKDSKSRDEIKPHALESHCAEQIIGHALMLGVINVVRQSVEQSIMDSGCELDEEVHSNSKRLEELTDQLICDDDNEFRSFENTKSDLTVMINATCHQMPAFCVVLLPWDEAHAATVHYVHGVMVRKSCSSLLRCQEAELQRVHTLSAVVYGIMSGPRNVRGCKWLNEYGDNLGWRCTSNLWSDAALKREKFYPETQSLFGDVALLLRHEDLDLPVVRHWLAERTAEYEPMRLLRLQREGREREWRMKNYGIFRNKVFELAALLQRSFEDVFEVQTQVVKVNSYFHFICRIMISRFVKCQQLLKHRIGDATSDLDEASILDTDVGYRDDILARFEDVPDNNSNDLFFKSVAEPSFNFEAAKFLPRVGQVIYAIYQLHCATCHNSTNSCQFPGCRAIRCAAGNSPPAPLSIELDIYSTSDNLCTTGRHPLEISIHDYFRYGKEFYNHTVLRTCHEEAVPDSHTQLAVEQALDKQAVEFVQIQERLKLRWVTVENEARLIRFVHRRVLRVQLAGALNFDELHEAIGGLSRPADEDLLSSEEKALGLQFVKTLSEQRLIKDITKKRVKQEGFGQVVKSADAIDLVDIPCELPRTMLGCRGIDGHGKQVALAAVDPYPCLERGERSMPMAHEMFDWLMSHMKGSRPFRLPSGSGDRGQRVTQPLALKYDRLHGEAAATLTDGSLVIIQVLHGVLGNASLCPDADSGAPPGALRWCPTNLLPDIAPGLTVLVYDIMSDVSRALAIDGMTLSRMAETFGISADDYPAISTEILKNATKIVRLSRVGENCTAVSIDLNSISKFPSKKHSRKSISPAHLKSTVSSKIPQQKQIHTTGRRHIIVNRHLTMMKLILDDST